MLYVSFVVSVMYYERKIKVVHVSHAVSEKYQIYDLKFKYMHKQCQLFQHYLLYAVLTMFVSVKITSLIIFMQICKICTHLVMHTILFSNDTMLCK
jgi:hypothetical protein